MFKRANKRRSLKRDIVRYGLIEVCIGEVLRPCKRWLRFYRVASRTLGSYSSEQQRIVSENRILTTDEMRGLPKVFPGQISNTFIDQAIERADICVGSFVEGLVAAYAWSSANTAPDNRGLWVRVKKPYCYRYKSYTIPEYRGLRIRSATVSDTYFLDRGFTHTLAYIERDNLASIKRQHRRGLHSYLGYVIIITVFGRLFLHHTPGVKEVGFQLYQRETEDEVSRT